MPMFSAGFVDAAGVNRIGTELLRPVEMFSLKNKDPIQLLTRLRTTLLPMNLSLDTAKMSESDTELYWERSFEYDSERSIH